MKAFLILTFSFLVFVSYSQKLLTKDTCINGKSVMTFENRNLPLRASWVDNEFLLFTNERDFKKYFWNCNLVKRDSIISKINFEKNNVIIFSISTGGCMYPTITAEYFGGSVQVKICVNGGCDRLTHATEYFIISKSISIGSQVNICKIYNNY